TNNVRNPHQPPERIVYGPQTTDEMAELWLQVLARSRQDSQTLARAVQAKMQQVFLARNAYLLKLNPDDAEAHNGMGISLLALGGATDAVRHFRAATQLRPDYEDPHFYLGYLYRQQKRLLDAASEYETVVRINPDNSEAHGNLGLTYAELGSLDRA